LIELIVAVRLAGLHVAWLAEHPEIRKRPERYITSKGRGLARRIRSRYGLPPAEGDDAAEIDLRAILVAAADERLLTSCLWEGSN
jgi:hypothetical protein